MWSSTRVKYGWGPFGSGAPESVTGSEDGTGAGVIDWGAGDSGLGGDTTAGATASAICGVGECITCFVVPASLSGASCKPTTSASEVTNVIAPAAKTVTAPV